MASGRGSLSPRVSQPQGFSVSKHRVSQEINQGGKPSFRASRSKDLMASRPQAPIASEPRCHMATGPRVPGSSPRLAISFFRRDGTRCSDVPEVTNTSHPIDIFVAFSTMREAMLESSHSNACASTLFLFRPDDHPL